MSRKAIKSEAAIIQDYFAPLSAGYPGAFGLRDDCAVITPPAGMDLVVKTDPIRAGVHFLGWERARDIAWKALAVNVSDLAAKGADPLAYVMALSFPEAPEPDWLKDFSEGLLEAQTVFGMTLIGGDTDRAEGPFSIAITVFGTVPSGSMIQRGTARAGDELFVSGTLGDAAMGLIVAKETSRDPSMAKQIWPLNKAERAELEHRYLRPQPRLNLRDALHGSASAAMDISDGLVKDCERMCAASGVGAVLYANQQPLSPPARKVADALPEWLAGVAVGGDDYEILAAIPRDRAASFASAATEAGIRVTRIGECVPGSSVQFLDIDGSPIQLNRKGWDHF